MTCSPETRHSHDIEGIRWNDSRMTPRMTMTIPMLLSNGIDRSLWFKRVAMEILRLLLVGLGCSDRAVQAAFLLPRPRRDPASEARTHPVLAVEGKDMA
jgi:hypothetical protein